MEDYPKSSHRRSLDQVVCKKNVAWPCGMDETAHSNWATCVHVGGSGGHLRYFLNHHPRRACTACGIGVEVVSFSSAH
jgi:hypothetical protein